MGQRQVVHVLGHVLGEGVLTAALVSMTISA